MIKFDELLIRKMLVSNRGKIRICSIFTEGFAMHKKTNYVYSLLVQRLKLAYILNQFNIDSRDLSGSNKKH